MCQTYHMVGKFVDPLNSLKKNSDNLQFCTYHLRLGPSSTQIYLPLSIEHCANLIFMPSKFTKITVPISNIAISVSFPFAKEREEIEEIDLRKVTDIRSPVSGGSYEQQCIFTVYMSDK